MFRRRQLLPCFSSYCLNSHITLVWRLSLQTASSFFQKLWSWFTQHAALTCFAATSFCIVSKATVMIRITLVWLVLPTSASFHEIPVQSWFEQHVCVTFLAVTNLCLVSQAIVAIRTVRSFDVFHRSPLLCFTSYCRDPSKYVCLTNFAATNSALFHKLLSWFEHYVRLTVFTAANVCFVSQATVMLRATCLFDTFHCRQPAPRFTSYMYWCTVVIRTITLVWRVWPPPTSASFHKHLCIVLTDTHVSQITSQHHMNLHLQFSVTVICSLV